MSPYKYNLVFRPNKKRDVEIALRLKRDIVKNFVY